MAVNPRTGVARSDRRGGAARPAQRRRTRKAIVDATIALLAGGTTPTVADVATAADVSRRTIFLYFPTFDQLLLDATVGALSAASMDRALLSSSSADTIDDRLVRMVRAFQHVSPELEQLGRSLVRLTVDHRAAGPSSVPRRGYRRIEWIESSLSPLRDRLAPGLWRRLVAAIAMIVGWEALIVQRDVCGFGVAEGEELSVWAGRALLRAALHDARQSRRPRSTNRRRASGRKE